MSFTPNAEHGTTVYGNYLTLADVKEYFQIPSTDTSRDFALQWAIDAACSGVQSFCDRPIGRTLFAPPVHGVFNGGSGAASAYIMLPKAPVLQVVEVIEYQGSTPVTLNEVAPSSGGDGYRVNYVAGYLERITGGVFQRPWMPSEMGVLVTWWAGMNPIPGDLRMATVEYARHLFTNSQQSFATQGARSPLGQTSPGEMTGPWPGIPGWLKGQLQPYVMPSVG